MASLAFAVLVSIAAALLYFLERLFGPYVRGTLEDRRRRKLEFDEEAMRLLYLVDKLSAPPPQEAALPDKSEPPVELRDSS